MSDEISVSTELELKTIGCLGKLVSRYEDGLLTKDQLSASLDSVWECVSGLTPPGSAIPDTLTDLMNQAKFDVSIYRRHFYKGTHLISFTWKVGYSSYSALMRDCGQAISGKSYPCASAREARDRMDATMAELLTKGWSAL